MAKEFKNLRVFRKIVQDATKIRIPVSSKQEEKQHVQSAMDLTIGKNVSLIIIHQGLNWMELTSR